MEVEEVGDGGDGGSDGGDGGGRRRPTHPPPPPSSLATSRRASLTGLIGRRSLNHARGLVTPRLLGRVDRALALL